MKRFKIISAMALVLILSLAMAAPVSAGADPSGLTAELCDDAICLSWTPSTAHYDFQFLVIWRRGDHYGNMAIDYDSRARVPLHYLTIVPAENPGESVAYSFRVYAMKYGDGPSLFVGRTEIVTLDVPTELTN